MFRCSAEGKPSGKGGVLGTLRAQPPPPFPCGFPSALPFPNPFPSQAMLFGDCRLYSGGCCRGCCGVLHFIGGLLAFYCRLLHFIGVLLRIVAFYRLIVGGLNHSDLRGYHFREVTKMVRALCFFGGAGRFFYCFKNLALIRRFFMIR